MPASKKARGLSEESAEFLHAPAASHAGSIGPVRATVGEGGRLVIPAEMRRGMGVKPGDTLILKVSDGELTAALKTSGAGARRSDGPRGNPVEIKAPFKTCAIHDDAIDERR